MVLCTIVPAQWGMAQPEADAPSVLVQTVAARQGSLPDRIEAFGTIGAALDGGTTVAMQQEGRVAAIHVTAGEAVHQGDSLITFVPSAAARAGYEQALTALALAQGQRARAGQLLAQHLGTRDQLAQADKALADAQAGLQAQRREGAGTAQITVAAPADGIITAVPVSQGDRVQAGAPLLTLTPRAGLVLTVGVEPDARGRVHPGQEAALTALEGGTPIQGEVLRIDGALNPKSRLVDADISVPQEAVLPGAAFSAAIVVGTLSGWVVPHAAVQLDGDSFVLFQVRQGKAVRVIVRVLGGDGRDDVVDGPLTAGLPVVVAGNSQLEDAARVRESPGQ